MTPASRNAFSRGLLRPLLPSIATITSPCPFTHLKKAVKPESLAAYLFVTTAASDTFTWAHTNPLESGSIPMLSLVPICSSSRKESTVPFRHPCNELLLPMGAGICFIRPERSLWRWQSPTSRLSQRQLTRRSNNATRKFCTHQPHPSSTLPIHISTYPQSLSLPPPHPLLNCHHRFSPSAPYSILQAHALEADWHGRRGHTIL